MAEAKSELAESASLEDRINSKFDLLPDQGDTELPETEDSELPEELDSADSEDVGEAPSPFEEIEFEGKAYRVPSELKNSLMTKADYTCKTQEIARNRENLELHQKQV